MKECEQYFSSPSLLYHLFVSPLPWLSLLKAGECAYSKNGLYWDLQKLCKIQPIPPHKYINTKNARRCFNLRYFTRKLDQLSPKVNIYRHFWRVNKALVEMLQSLFCILFRLETHETELAKLPVFGELQPTVRQCSKVSEHRTEPLLLHLWDITSTNVNERRWQLSYPGGYQLKLRMMSIVEWLLLTGQLPAVSAFVN